MSTNEVPFNTLKGRTLAKVEKIGDDRIVFTTMGGDVFTMYHEQDCCESVYVESITGDLADLVGEPLLLAEEADGETAQPVGWQPDEYEESYTWTFYKLATRKGYVDIRWYGSSNGYYSERVYFVHGKEHVWDWSGR